MMMRSGLFQKRYYLSYKHGFHVGNHGDVSKHVVLIELIGRLKDLGLPLAYIDSHAGSGFYRLKMGEPARTDEYKRGIEKLLELQTNNHPMKNYLSLIKSFNKSDEFRAYPGSPMIAASLLDDRDQGVAFELHNKEFPLLQRHLNQFPNFTPLHQDGVAGLLTHVQKFKNFQILALVDPSYEMPNECDQLAAMFSKVAHVENLCMAIWYPLFQGESKHENMIQGFKSKCDSWLNLSLTVAGNDFEKKMYGSGMFILNPPKGIETSLRSAYDILDEKLRQKENPILRKFETSTHIN